MKFLFNNFWYKILSLLLAIIVWAIIQGEQVLEQNRELIVELQVPEGYMVRGDTTRALAATLKGPRVMVMEAPRVLKTKVALPPRKGKRARVRITPEQFSGINPRLNLTIHDPYFYVFIDEQATRTVPVRYIPHGTPADGYFVKKVILNPSHVKITGLKSDLIKIREVATVAVDITGLDKDRSVTKALIPPSGVLPQHLSDNEVNITLQVGDSFINQRYGSIPIDVVGSQYGFATRPKFASIVIQGTPQTLKFVKSEDLKAFVEATELKPGRYELEIKVKIPPDTVLIESFPQKATVEISDEKK